MSVPTNPSLTGWRHAASSHENIGAGMRNMISHFLEWNFFVPQRLEDQKDCFSKPVGWCWEDLTILAWDAAVMNSGEMK